MILVRDNEVVASGAKQGNDICRMFFKVVKPSSVDEANVLSSNLNVWHERLGHVGNRAICELVKKGLVTDVTLSGRSDFFCAPCQYGKAYRLAFRQDSVKRSTMSGEVMHTDVCELMSVESLGGAKVLFNIQGRCK